MNSTKRQQRPVCPVRKADFILIIGCLLMAVCTGVFFVLHRGEGRTARVTCDGAELAVIALDAAKPGREDTYYLIRDTGTGTAIEGYRTCPALPEEGSFNLFSVVNGRVNMEAADCRDQVCVRHRPVSAGGESIICLPHKLVIEITDRPVSDSGRQRQTLDGVVE